MNRNHLYIHLVLFLILSMLMWWIKTIFYISEEIAHPQFTQYDQYDRIMTTIREKDKVVWFHRFFITDLVWSFFLLGFFVHWLHFLTGNWGKRLMILTTMAFFAWFVDAMEGVIYVSGNLVKILGLVSLAKYGLYILVILLFAVFALRIRSVNRVTS